MKKTLKMMFVSALMCTLTGCAGTADKEEAAAASPSAAAETSAPAETASASEDAGQNPVMNFVGPYAADRASMMVEAEGDKDAKITVRWGSSAFETTEWVMSGMLDTETLTVEYDNCVKTDKVYDSEGKETAEILYENGTGRVIFDGLSGTLTWEDDQEQAGEGLVFTFSYPQESSADAERFIGKWVCGRAVIDITETDREDTPFNVMISWGNTAAEHTEWVYDCYYDGNALTSFETGTKTTIVFNDKGEIESSKEEFNDGAVSLLINDEGKLIWYEFKEDAGKDMEFEKVQ